MSLFKKKKNYSLIIVICVIIVVFITLLIIVTNKDKNVEKFKEETLVSSSEELLNVVPDSSSIKLTEDIVLDLNYYSIDHDLEIDLNGCNLQIVGTLLANENAISITDSTDEGTLDITNLNISTIDLKIDEPTNRNIDIIKVDIDKDRIISNPDGTENVEVDDSDKYVIYYPYINFVYQSTTEATQLDDYFSNNNNYDKLTITKPIAVHLKEVTLTNNMYINVLEDGKVTLSGSINFNNKTINIISNNFTQLDLSELIVTAKDDDVLFTINTYDLDKITLPINTILKDNNIVYKKQ